MILAVAILARLPIALEPTEATVGWHAADYGSIARNFYLNGFDFLRPQVDWGGDGPGYVEMEFPIVPFLTAVIYAAAGGVDDRWAIAVPMAAGLLAVALTFMLARALFGTAIAILAGLVVALSPTLARYSGLFFPETLLLAGSVAAVYCVLLWSRSGRVDLLMWGAAGACLAVLLKPTLLVIGAPLFWLFWLRQRGALWRRPEIYLFGLAVLGPPVWWYAHAFDLATTYGNSFGILFGGGPSKFDLAILTSMDFYVSKLGGRFLVYHLTPFACAGILWAFVRRRFTDEQRVVVIWFWATVLTLLVAAGGNHEASYYQLPVVLPAAILAGVGLHGIWHALVSWTSPQRAWVPATLILTGLATGATTGAVLHAASSDYAVFYGWTRTAGLAAGRVMRPGDLMIYAEQAHRDEQRGHHVTPSFPFYYTGHRGWFLAYDWLTIRETEELRCRGARYFVAESEGSLATARPDFRNYLSNFARVPGPSAYAIWDLSREERTSTCDIERWGR